LAGLQKGDLLTAIDNAPITGAADLRNRIALSVPKAQVILEYYRNGMRATTTAVLETL
jgi:S1-C subfamily serine protease